jgi:hypothetical protein
MGNVAGLLPGSGSIADGQTFDTANLTPVFATGTVMLNNTNGNYFLRRRNYHRRGDFEHQQYVVARWR